MFLGGPPHKERNKLIAMGKMRTTFIPYTSTPTEEKLVS